MITIVFHGNEALKLINQHFLIAFSKFQDDVIAVHKSLPSHIYIYRTLHFTNLLLKFIPYFPDDSFSTFLFLLCVSIFVSNRQTRFTNDTSIIFLKNENFGKYFLILISCKRFFLRKICKKNEILLNVDIILNLKKILKIFLENFNENYFVERIYEFFL